MADNSPGPSPLIRSFQLDTHTGTLKQVGTPVTSDWSNTLATDPMGRFLYVGPVPTPDQTVLGYQITPASGQLAPAPGSPFFAVNGAHILAIDPSGKFIYADGTGFSIDPSTGALTAIHNSLGPALITKDGIAINFFCPTVGSAGTLSSYRIDATGNLINLANVSDLCIGGLAMPIADPSGRFIYINQGIFKLDPNTGDMTQMQPPGSGVPAPGAFDPLGRFAYVGLDAYRIDSTSGALTAVPGSPNSGQFSVGGNPAVDPSGRFLITVSGATYSIDQKSGVLTQVQQAMPFNSTAIIFLPPQS